MPMTLERFFYENPSAALGFSGGVDSSYLLYAGLRYGAKIKAYYVKTAFQPDFELRDAYSLAERIGTVITVIELNVLDNPQVVANPPDRCYYCKSMIFGSIKQKAVAQGYTLLLDGTNASDDAADRAGMKATGELGVRSPLRECGISKADVRRLSKEAGLFTWDKPAYACLATRVQTGQEITDDLLRRVELAENTLFDLGFSDLRVRIRGQDAVLQFPLSSIEYAWRAREEIKRMLKPLFSSVLLDLEARQESM